MRLQHDLRDSPRHKALLETRSSLAYLPHALTWACRFEVMAIAVIFGSILGMFGASWLGFVFILLFGGAALTWLLTVQSRAIWGFGDPPGFDYELIRHTGSIVPRVIAFGTVVVLAYAALDGAPPPWQRVFAWFAGALFPAVFAILAVDDELMPAFDPRRILRVLIASGPVGWILSVLSAWSLEAGMRHLLAMLAVFDLDRLVDVMTGFSPSLTAVAGSIAGLWVLALMFHLHGHALHHRHELAGIGVYLDAADDSERAAGRCARAVERVATALEDAQKREDRAAAHQLAAAPPPEGVDELIYYSALWERLFGARKYPVALLVAGRLLKSAASRKRYPLALETLQLAWREMPGFEPGLAVRLALAQSALTAGDQAGFDRLTDIDPDAWPDDPDAVEVAFMRADWLADKRGEFADARTLLEKVLHREHALAQRIAALHTVLGEKR